LELSQNKYYLQRSFIHYGIPLDIPATVHEEERAKLAQYKETLAKSDEMLGKN